MYSQVVNSIESQTISCPRNSEGMECRFKWYLFKQYILSRAKRINCWKSVCFTSYMSVFIIKEHASKLSNIHTCANKQTKKNIRPKSIPIASLKCQSVEIKVNELHFCCTVRSSVYLEQNLCIFQKEKNCSIRYNTCTYL